MNIEKTNQSIIHLVLKLVIDYLKKKGKDNVLFNYREDISIEKGVQSLIVDLFDESTRNKDTFLKICFKIPILMFKGEIDKEKIEISILSNTMYTEDELQHFIINLKRNLDQEL